MRKGLKNIVLLILFSHSLILFGQVPTEGLVVSYPFKGNANDESINGYNGVVYGANLTQDRCGIENSAYLFDGFDDNIYIGDITDFDGANTLSISAWIYSDGITDQHSGTIVSKYNANGDSERVFTFDLYPDNILRFIVYGLDGNGDYEWQRTSNPIPFSQWNHVVVCWDGLLHNIDFFVNGVEVASHYGKLGNNPTKIFDKISPLMIGSTEYGHTSNDYLFNGKIDEVIIYNRVLTNEEILSLYYYNCQELDLIGEEFVCEGQENVEYSVLGASNANYLWNYTGIGASIFGDSESIRIDFSEDATSGVLSVLVWGDSIDNQTLELPIEINSHLLEIGTIHGDDVVCKDYENVYYVTPLEDIQSYLWQFSEIDANISSYNDNAVIIFSDAVSGYLTVSAENGCGSVTSPPFQVSVNPCELNIPNSFTPNGDNINDVFYIRNLPENSKVLIFNRLGKELYATDNYQNDWDGQDKEGSILNSDTYWYIITVPVVKKEFTGFVYLKR